MLPQAIEVSLEGGTKPVSDSRPASPQAQGGSFNADEQRYPAPARHAEVITASQLPLDHVERVEHGELSPATFHRQYVLRCRPVIISDALRDWPLYNMSQEDSIRHFEGLQGMIRTGDYVARTFSKNRQFKTASMADFIRSSRDHAAVEQSEPPPYLGSNSIPESLETLIGWPEYFRRDQYIPPRIWIGLPAILFEIRLPLPGWVSILHRASGALLVFPFTAWLLYLLDASLASESGFRAVQGYLDLPLAKLGMLVLIWALCHHLCAGIRYLFLDLNKGIELGPARASSAAVLAVSLLLTAYFGWQLWS